MILRGATLACRSRHAAPARPRALVPGRRLFADLTVRETVQVARIRRPRGPGLGGAGPPAADGSKRAKRSQADEIIAFLGLGAFADRFINELSTGTRRIVELACLVAVEPRVLCLDEPTAGIASARPKRSDR